MWMEKHMDINKESNISVLQEQNITAYYFFLTILYLNRLTSLVQKICRFAQRIPAAPPPLPLLGKKYISECLHTLMNK